MGIDMNCEVCPDGPGFGASYLGYRALCEAVERATGENDALVCGVEDLWPPKVCRVHAALLVRAIDLMRDVEPDHIVEYAEALLVVVQHCADAGHTAQIW